MISLERKTHVKKKMQKEMPWRTMDDGRRVRFDWVRFHEEVDNMERKPHQSKSDIFRGIIRAIYPGYPEESIDSNISTCSKWYAGKNGPRDLLEIYKPLAEFFKCEEDSFLEFEEVEENPMMNMTTAQAKCTLANGREYPAGDDRMMIKALAHLKEKEVAHELYNVLVDLIAAYLPVDEETWVEKRGEHEWIEKLKEYPKRYSADMAIKKAALYLPKELRYRAQGLLDDMYGERIFGWQEQALGGPFGNQSFDAFYDNKLRQFDEYVKQHGDDPKTLDEDERNNYWVFLMQEEDLELFSKLDDIFSDYLCD